MENQFGHSYWNSEPRFVFILFILFVYTSMWSETIVDVLTKNINVLNKLILLNTISYFWIFF